MKKEVEIEQAIHYFGISLSDRALNPAGHLDVTCGACVYESLVSRATLDLFRKRREGVNYGTAVEYQKPLFPAEVALDAGEASS